ncbi:hypothetical protein [Thalassobius sp. I31.1]|uniref:hypothetical protein n=1 Tax=Thalassobius sp. I31.1 TaxID=2109912 RepID=UPI000D198416|nr:hypothetical protein [Thalassobius sp. I31.1]
MIAIPGTGIKDIRPLTSLPNLQALDIRESEAGDLRPILKMPHLYRDPSSPTPIQSPAFQFSGCKATKLDPKLQELSEIENGQKRFIETVRYLSTLPAYPALLPSEEHRIYRDISQQIEQFNEASSQIAAQITGLNETLKVERSKVWSEMNKQLSSGREKLKEFNALSTTLKEEREKDRKALDAFKEEFTERVAVSEPAQLWAEKQTEHETQQQKSFWWFI